MLSAAERYRRAGRFAHGFAKGKIVRDPAYSAILSELRAISPQSAGPSTLVDVGCGEGYLLACVREVFPEWSLFGLDHDQRRLDVAHCALEGESKIDIRCADMRALAFPNADAYVCLDVLHYVPPADQDEVLGRIAAQLSPGGRLLVRDGERDWSWRSILLGISERLAILTGRHRGEGLFLRRKGELRSALERFGLEVREVACRKGTPFSNVLLVAAQPVERTVGGG